MGHERSLRILLIVVIAAVIVGGVQYARMNGELQATRAALLQQRTNAQVAEFMRLVIADVLRARGEVPFETRLKLETAVRAIGDAEILTAWQRFTASDTERAAQAAVRDLLELLTKKVVVIETPTAAPVPEA